MSYNATVHETKNEEKWGTFVADVKEINGNLQMLSANSVKTYQYENKILTEDIPELNAQKGDSLFHLYMTRLNPNSEYEIIVDNCEGYKNALFS